MESHEKVGEKEVLQKVVESFISHAELQLMEAIGSELTLFKLFKHVVSI